MQKNEFIKVNNFKPILLKFVLAIFLILFSTLTITTFISMADTSFGSNYVEYTFNYLTEYYYENEQNYYGNDVIINATNDIIEKNNNGWAENDIIVDYNSQGSFVTNYGEFASGKYALTWASQTIKVARDKKPDLSKIRDNFNCFYNIFQYWKCGDKAYLSANLPEGGGTFTAQYTIKQKIKLEADDQELLNYYPNSYADIEFKEAPDKLNGNTVYYYLFNYNEFYQNSTGHYKYMLIKNGIDYGKGYIKICPININNDDLVFTLTTKQFKDQNQFNEFRAKHTGKEYKATFGNAIADSIISLTGTGGILDSTASMISSTGTMASGVMKVGATGLESFASSIWMFSDLISNLKTTLVYIITIAIACLITVLVLSLIFWVIRKVTKIAKKAVRDNG